ncbi:MAG: D-alanine--D-alanine ligase, partial [Nitrospirae bacterium]|nr:D-alanine--D-alanine ligase [Nitrospirota bacterium]
MNRKNLRTKKIGVLLGGTSSERDVSLRSGHAIFNALRSAGYNAALIDAKGDLCTRLKKEHVDIAFIALHGGHGENGAVQGMLEIMGIPYSGSGVLASALAMDKEASKKIFLYHGIPVPSFSVLRASDRRDGQKTRFPLPWVVKPAAEGSSVGVEIVKTRAAFTKALKTAFSYGNRVIVEKYIAGKEVQIGILNNTVLGGVEVRPSLEFYSYEA